MYHKYIRRRGNHWSIAIQSRLPPRSIILKSVNDSDFNGDEDESLKEAIRIRNQVCEHECIPNNVHKNFHTCSKVNKTSSLPVGIYERVPTLTNQLKSQHIKCSWITYSGEEKSKHFSVNKYGREEAIEMAINYRNERLKEKFIESQTCIIKD